jgi:hypothetical protein
MYTCTAAPSASPAFPSGGQPVGPVKVGGWQPAGTGDCAGHDVGGTAGASPDPSKCDVGFSGLTAVCWSNGCSYKNVATSACTGGTSPGQMYTCEPGASAPPPPPPPSPPKVNGKRYHMLNYTGETENPHDFIIDWNGCKVAEMSEEYRRGDETITVLGCKPGRRLLVKTEFKISGYWAQYDWVSLDKGATVAGAYRDQAGCGPSAGKRVK